MDLGQAAFPAPLIFGTPGEKEKDIFRVTIAMPAMDSEIRDGDR